MSPSLQFGQNLHLSATGSIGLGVEEAIFGFKFCKFNQKCYFIHPDCKFDPYCTKADCPFLHRHVRTAKPPNHFKNTYSYTPDSKTAFPTRSQLTWTPGQKVVKEKEEETGRHISERKFALEDVQTVLIPKPES